MLEIDGSHGEGGGQILRTALALSCVTGTPFRVKNLRAGRPKPGLQPQHLASVRAAQAVCGASVSGDERGSRELRFEPGPLRGGDLALDVGTAGSVTLVLQTVVPALLFAGGPSRIRIAGGTHVPWSPPFEYLSEVFAPMLARLGGTLRLALGRPGFYPAGGGLVQAETKAAAGLRALSCVADGAVLRVSGVSAVGRLPAGIAARQREAAAALLRARVGGHAAVEIEDRVVDSPTPGTYLFLRAQARDAVCGFSALGAGGKRAEAVGEEAAQALLAHAAAGAPLDPHLADQLVPYLALAAGTSEIATSRVSRHLLTNLWTVERFLPARCVVEGREGEPGRIRVVGAGVTSPP